MILLIMCIAGASASVMTPNDAYKDQFCTDPRTMKRHSAYTEWADAYSCTRHRCQPGGRNLAIYTVGCKRVEAPESAIECEEVVEDTNMQFPYCCTRLRCLVVVRGEVWTRVLGQPWETLPAAPWSHMYKMKKPPPGNELTPKVANEGPVYELTDSDNDKPKETKVMRAFKVPEAEYSTQPETHLRQPQSPDIVIALTTNNDHKEPSKTENTERQRHNPLTQNQYYDEENPSELREHDEGQDDSTTENPRNLLKKWVKNRSSTDQPPVPSPSPQEISEEKDGREARDAREYASSYSYQNQKVKEQHQREWPDVPQEQWSEPEQDPQKDINYRQQDSSPPPDTPNKAPPKSAHLQALVDAIGSRMRDIETVVQKMSEKVKDTALPKPELKSDEPEASSLERSQQQDTELHGKYSQERKAKKTRVDGDQYKRFTVRNRGSKYLHGTVDGSTEAPVFGGDNGYFSDASNSVLRRSNPGIEPKVEPAQAPTYMAPVENRRKTPQPVASSSEEKMSKKHRKKSHKKKRKGVHKRHHKEGEKKRKFNRANSVENDRIVISLEDSSAVVNNNN